MAFDGTALLFAFSFADVQTAHLEVNLSIQFLAHIFFVF